MLKRSRTEAAAHRDTAGCAGRMLPLQQQRLQRSGERSALRHQTQRPVRRAAAEPRSSHIGKNTWHDNIAQPRHNSSQNRVCVCVCVILSILSEQSFERVWAYSRWTCGGVFTHMCVKMSTIAFFVIVHLNTTQVMFTVQPRPCTFTKQFVFKYYKTQTQTRSTRS